MQQIEVLAPDAPGGAPLPFPPRMRERVRVGAELGGLVGGVPALRDLVESVGKLVCRVILKPRGFDHAAAQWRRGLLVLAGNPRDEVPGGYSPKVRRSCAIISGGSRSGCNASPALRAKIWLPNTVSTRCTSSASASAGRRTTSQSSCAIT